MNHIIKAIHRHSTTHSIPLLQSSNLLTSNPPSAVRAELSSGKKQKKALALLPPSFEEIELITPVDILRRGGVEVTIAGTKGANVTPGLQCVSIKPDCDLADVCGPYDAVILGGDRKATDRMSKCKKVKKLLQTQEKECKIVAAICCAPLVLMAHCVGKKKRLTSSPSSEKEIRDSCLFKYKCDDVVVDNWLITARGPAMAMQWALTILMHLMDERTACSVGKTMMVK